MVPRHRHRRTTPSPSASSPPNAPSKGPSLDSVRTSVREPNAPPHSPVDRHTTPPSAARSDARRATVACGGSGSSSSQSARRAMPPHISDTHTVLAPPASCHRRHKSSGKGSQGNGKGQTAKSYLFLLSFGAFLLVGSRRGAVGLLVETDEVGEVVEAALLGDAGNLHIGMVVQQLVGDIHSHFHDVFLGW